MQTASSAPNFNYGYPTPGPQHPTGSAVMDHVFFLSQGDWKRVREEEDFDFIVIGTGFCTLAFAERALSNNPNARILIIERGPFFLPEHFQNLPLPYQETLGGLSETFPWTLSQATRDQNLWQHGMVPFFGGRSTLWSAWCPRPTTEELRDWPKELINKLENKYFEAAETLLNVVTADKLDQGSSAPPPGYRPVFGTLQRELTEMLKENYKSKIPSATRVMPAPLAVRSESSGVDFEKFAVPGPLLSLLMKQRDRAQKGEGATLKVVTNCTVERILHQEAGAYTKKKAVRKATALETSRGVVSVGEAQLILAMGTLPPTTLVLNSFPHLNERAGKRFTAHFITSVVARVLRKDYQFAADLAELELAAIYLAGAHPTTKRQYHVQLTALSDRDPTKNAQTASRHMPDVVATASMEQLLESEDYVVFVCAVLGELDENNPNSWFRRTHQGSDPTTNVLLQVLINENDSQLRDQMDNATFEALESVLCPPQGQVQYWHDDSHSWKTDRPPANQIHVSGLVHEASTMHIGDDEDAVVKLNYRLHDVDNVYVTGASLWPTSGSWNPTLTMVGLAQHLADNLQSPENEQRLHDVDNVHVKGARTSGRKEGSAHLADNLQNEQREQKKQRI